MATKGADRWTLRDLVYLGVFGGIWVLMESTFGSFLHSTRVPEKGSILAGVAAIIMIVARHFVPKRGSTMVIGLATAMLKVLSTGGTVFGGPSIGIFAEATMAEIGFATGPLNRARAILAGALAGGWLAFHKFLTRGIIAGRGFLTVYRDAVEQTAELYGLNLDYAIAVFIGYALLKFVIGGVFGWIGWSVLQSVQAQMGQRQVAAKEA